MARCWEGFLEEAPFPSKSHRLGSSCWDLTPTLPCSPKLLVAMVGDKGLLSWGRSPASSITLHPRTAVL